MPKPRKPPDERRSMVQLDNEVAKYVRLIAGSMGISASQYVSERMTTIVQADLPAVLDSVKSGFKK